MTEKTWQYLNLQQAGNVLTVEFDSGNSVNSLNLALMEELTHLARDLQDNSQISAVILSGRRDTFTGGINLADPALQAIRTASVAEQRRALQSGPRMCAAWESLEQVTIAAVEGWCVGGGVVLAAACDWRVMSNAGAIYVPELRLGMNMSWQSIPRLINLVGPSRTKQLLILANPVDAATAEDWGLVDYCVPAGEVLAFAQDLGRKVAEMPPVPVRMTKRAVNACANALSEATSFMDADQFLLTQGMQDAAEGMAAFLEKRPPKFQGN